MPGSNNDKERAKIKIILLFKIGRTLAIQF